MKILVAYFSQTGNTEKIARAMHDELSTGHQVDMARIDETGPDTAESYDLVFVGSPCHAGDLSAQARSFLIGLPQRGAFSLAGFVTHASSAYEREGFQRCIETLETISRGKEIPFLGCFDCQGYLSPEIQPYVKKTRNVSDEQWERIIEAMTGHPDAGDEKEARTFARRQIGRI